MPGILVLLAPGCTLITNAEHETRIDGDADGFLDAAFGGDDCDDEDRDVHPAADEVCGGVDENCDGVEDEGAVDGFVVYADVDGDGYGDATAPMTVCDPVDGYVANADDCDDALAAAFPGAPETDCDDPVDYNCDGSSGTDDADGDGLIACEDCADTDASVHPGASEVCDGLDQDCDGEVDDDPTDAPVWHADTDGDGYGGGEAVAACEQPDGYVSDGTDCDDAEARVNPAASEVCDDLDQDCDEEVDEVAECAVDSDGDGVVDWREEQAGTDPSGVDSDGDGLEDGEEESLGTDPLLPDSDRDGLNDGEEAALGLDPMAADSDGDGLGDYDEVTVDTDADGLTDWDEAGTWDTDPNDPDSDGDGLADGDDVAAGADPLDPDSDGDGVDDGMEVALGLDPMATDSDGDGTDDATEVAADFTWYVDVDGDGFGDADGSVVSATLPAGYADDATDCDDGDGAVNPGASEVCGGSDEDCSGAGDDDAIDVLTWYADVDADGYGDAATTWVACDAPAAYVEDDTDCDDGDAGVNPGAGEVCNDGVDQNCDDSYAPCGPADASLADADAQFTGEAAGDLAGYTVAGARDVNGDGYDDLIVGAAYNDDAGLGAGAAYFVLGSPTPTAQALSLADARYTGAAAEDAAAFSVSGLGDVDADGYDDAIIGATGNDDGGESAGAAYLLLGSPTLASQSLTSAGVVYTGDPGDVAGWSVSGAGDVNDDGYCDLLVGSFYNDDGGEYSGATWLVLGSTSLLSQALASANAQYTGAVRDRAGTSVSGAGDVDADGYDDVIIGAPDNGDGGPYAGAVYLVLGKSSPASQDLASASAQYTGEAPSDQAGYRAAGAGDVDADGYDDVIIGAPDNDGGGNSAGAAYLVLGVPVPVSRGLSSADARYIGEGPSHQAGRSVAGTGDVDADGFADLIVGADGAGTAAEGAAYLVLGNAFPASHDLASANAKYSGAAATDLAGSSVSGVSDVNADGFADFLVGAYANDDAGSSAGAAYLILGSGL